MNKSQLLDRLAKESGVAKADVKAVVESLVDLIQTEVKKGREVKIDGLGKFLMHKSKARKGRNPATGETIKIKAKKTAKFRAAKAFRDLVK